MANCHSVVKRAMRASVEQYSLKSLEPFHEFKRAIPLNEAATAMRIMQHALELARAEGILITMGCGDKCSYVPGLRREDWPLPDPKGQSIEEVRAIRNEVKRGVQELLVNEDLNKS
jgi:protein-tyrosine-phosphatase